MTKYQQVVQLMLTQNKQLFDDFRKIHDAYAANPKQNQQKFNEIGLDVQDVIRRYENILCGHSENTGFSKFSTQLAEKFQAEIRSIFPKIDFVGLKN